jgi:hypothetical protein
LETLVEAYSSRQVQLLGMITTRIDLSIDGQYRGTYYGTKADFDALSSSWNSTLKPDNFTSGTHNWYDGLLALSGPLSTEQPEPSINFFAKSIFFKSAVTSTQWTNLFDYIAKEGLNTGYTWFIEVDRKPPWNHLLSWLIIERRIWRRRVQKSTGRHVICASGRSHLFPAVRWCNC